MSCNTNDNNTNAIPFGSPKIVIIADIVYPKQNPLYSTIPNTIGIPITVVPKNQSVNANIIFSFKVVLNNSILSIFSVFFNLSINVLKYDVISEICVSCVLFINITPKNIPITNIKVTKIYSLLLFNI